ncbi:PTS glucitol/sorbitol transporter subunit IIB [Propionispora hippei]|uniref:PTS system, glucitol/sorbitol-specific IIC component n=1 Tax=Propionispora hippei DSM 15287 TaxID=1123003 RepID=A0A1M6EZK8_9FIRM|nr:PTS glucitol/sorbitol transporter subunit IIB [Propionispora hippei]SHI90826.1 PTS system, glucitol/sorbitol-specific IIC component [Propionispora hippei DSM 15287]
MYRAITITRGNSGWGGPLTIMPTDTCHKVVSVTGGGIHPLAVKIAELSGCEVIDGFTTAVPDSEMFVAVVDCAGTARCGVYPKKNVFTVNLTPVGKVGPLAKFITETLYVSDVTENCISYAPEGAILTSKDGSQAQATAPASPAEPKTKAQARAEIAAMSAGKKKNAITRLGIAVGGVVNKFYQAGRETIDMVIKSILPFMAFVSMIIGIIQVSGIGNVIAHTVSPLASTLPGMLLISIICSLPFVAPVIGPGAVIAQVVGTLLGVEIGLGHIPAQYALPALFAINAQVGGDFIPVGLSLGEADSETIELGVPAVLYSRLITGPLSVLIAFLFSFGMY